MMIMPLVAADCELKICDFGMARGLSAVGDDHSGKADDINVLLSLSSVVEFVTWSHLIACFSIMAP